VVPAWVHPLTRTSSRRSAWTPSPPSRTSLILCPGNLPWRPDRVHHPAAERTNPRSDTRTVSCLGDGGRQ
jgi:hypothetical protein